MNATKSIIERTRINSQREMLVCKQGKNAPFVAHKQHKQHHHIIVVNTVRTTCAPFNTVRTTFITLQLQYYNYCSPLAG